MKYLAALLLVFTSAASAAEPDNHDITLTLTVQDINDLGSNLVIAMRGCAQLADQQVPPCEQRAVQSMLILQHAVTAAQKPAEPKK
jgi:hypothetical protein